jgi:hypothetical protein
MSSAAPSLLEVERALRASLAGHEDEAAALHVVGDDIGAAERLSIYRNTSVATLVTALRLTFPAVCKLVGDEFFEGAARAFIAGHPARSAWLDEYGQGFESFIAQFAAASPLPYLADVAALEWSVSRALHAPEAAPIDPARLASLSEDDCRALCLVPHPALALVRTDSPADVIWRAVLEGDDATLGSVDPTQGPVHLLVERREGPEGTSVRVQRLDAPGWRLTAALCAGRPLSQALEDNTDAAVETVLAEHFARGRFIDFERVHSP